MVPPVLHTARLRLRPWTLDEAPLFHTIWGDPRVLWWGPAKDLAASRAVLADRLGQVAHMPAGMGWWAIEAPGDEEAAAHAGMVGNVVLRPAQYDDTVELAYHLRHGAWGRGYITEAAHGVLRHGFAQLGVPVISGIVHMDNAPSQRVMARLGLQPSGTLRHHDMPHTRYALCAGDAAALPWWPAALSAQ